MSHEMVYRAMLWVMDAKEKDRWHSSSDRQENGQEAMEYRRRVIQDSRCSESDI